MNKVSSAVIVAALGVVAVSACKQDAAATPVEVRAAMQQQVNPATMAIWDIGNNAMNDAGGIDPALMDDAKWAKLAESAGQLSAAGRALAAGERFIAASPEAAEVAEGEIAMADVQKYLDADPQGFSQMGAALADYADKLAAAASARDVKAAGDLVSGMDQVCEGCHTKYWYPEQQ